MGDFSLFEAINTQRSIRGFTSDPVPDEAIARIIEAATRAPSRGNVQPWHFLVIRDTEIKGRIGEHHWNSTMEGRQVDPPPGGSLHRCTMPATTSSSTWTRSPC